MNDEVLIVRRGAGLFEPGGRGVLEVGGSDAGRWLNGMLTNDVALLVEGPEHSGCPALVLTNRGRVVADVQVMLVPGGFWLETSRAAAADLAVRLARLVIADDVQLADRSDEIVRFGLEGPAARGILESAIGVGLSLAQDACVAVRLAGADVRVARFGWSGEDAYQLFVPSGCAAAVRDRLRASLPVGVAMACSDEALEVLRIEAGRPRLGAELSEDVLPPEARLEASLSYTKGCYIGQEIVARLRSRGHVNHLLVGLRFEGDALPERRVPVCAGDRTIGEITSTACSPHAGAIALAYVRVGHDSPGTQLEAGGLQARVAALPFVAAAEPVS